MSKKRVLWLVVGLVIVSPVGWGFFSHFMPAGLKVAATSEAQTPAPEGDRKLFVCYGYADLENGISALHPSQSGAWPRCW